MTRTKKGSPKTDSRTHSVLFGTAVSDVVFSCHNKYLTTTLLAHDEDEKDPDTNAPSDACKGSNCNRKFKKECIHSMCLNCCTGLSSESTVCDVHRQIIVKKKEEEALLNEWLRKGSKKRSAFVHFEDRFTDFRQTVVIWCLQDFSRNSKWSKETFDQQLRRLERNVRRKRKGEDIGGSERAASVSKRLSTASTRPRPPSETRYNKLKVLWTERIRQDGAPDNPYS